LGESRPSDDEPEITERLIAVIKQASLQRYPQGEVKRFNQAKGLGCLSAEFVVAPALPAELQQGLFQSGRVYPAQIRFVNASQENDTKKDFRGMSIKLFQVEGESLWGTDGVQDFVLNSYPVLFAATPKDFLAFVEAVKDEKVWKYFVNPRHFYSLLVVWKGRAQIASPFDIRYWSTTPYRFGEQRAAAVKYAVKPCSSLTSQMPHQPAPDYLVDAMKHHLQQAAVCFHFMVQFQTDPEAMPVEDAAVEWDEGVSPFLTLATITIPDQEFQTKPARQQCERMRFNPWQSLAAHQPLGGINRVRKAIYAELARFRTEENARRGLID
jgi:catalase